MSNSELQLPDLESMVEAFKKTHPMYKVTSMEEEVQPERIVLRVRAEPVPHPHPAITPFHCETCTDGKRVFVYAYTGGDIEELFRNTPRI